MADRFDVRGKVAVVTGGTKGLGRGFCTGLAEAGAKVVVSSRKQDLCDEVAAEIAAETGAEVVGMACHVGEWDAIPGFVDQVVERFGRIDILVNNAGISPALVPLVEMEEAYWDKVQDVNLKGPLRMSAVVAPIMRDHGGGSIVNISSVGGYRGGPRNSHYSTSKAALINLTQAMAAEWAEWGVRANVISPGPFRTTLLEGAAAKNPEYMANAAAGTMLGRVAEPDECVGALLLLASDAGGFITGEDLVVAGGQRR